VVYGRKTRGEVRSFLWILKMKKFNNISIRRFRHR